MGKDGKCFENMGLIKRRCFDCGYCENLKILQEHHILPKCYGGDNDIKNLVVLCPNCHKIRHLEFDTFIENSLNSGNRINKLTLGEFLKFKKVEWERRYYINLRKDFEGNSMDEREARLAHIDETIKKIQETTKSTQEFVKTIKDKDRRECA